MPKVISSAALLLLAFCLFGAPAKAGEDAVWWESAQNEADREGYRIIGTGGLSELLKQPTETTILDARADYEYEGGHIPGAVNFEFDLGDRTALSAERRKALTELLGPNKEQRLVIYCRSFR